LPGTIGITGPIFAELNEQVAEQLIVNGFKNVVLMGDHGGGQKELAEVAKKLDAKYAPLGIRVVYCGVVYEKAGAEFNKWAAANGYPAGEHASLKDISELLYLGCAPVDCGNRQARHRFEGGSGGRSDPAAPRSRRQSERAEVNPMPAAAV
jgi:creatinine amidohydrolase